MFLAFDGPSRRHHHTDWALAGALADLADAGYADRLLLGMDTTLASMRGAPGMSYLPRVLGPQLDRAIFFDNPARAFDADWRC